MMNTVALLIGGNQGNRQELTEQATALIRDRIGAVVAVSADYETEPWGDFGDDVPPPFLNRALLVQTDLTAHQVLAEALHIESLLGRVRPAPHHDSIPKSRGESAGAVDAGECSPETGELSAGLRGGSPEGGYTPSLLRGTPPVPGVESAGAVSAVEYVSELGKLSCGSNRTYHSRTMDIDLIFWNDEVIDTPDLQIPHPRAHLRRFVLEPLAEIMPDYKHPLLGLTVVQLLRRLAD